MDKKGRNRNHRYTRYDDLAGVYNRHWGDRFLPPALAALDKLALGRVAPNAGVLDLCCGTGQLAKVLTERGYQVTGLDGSEEMLKYARQNAPGAGFILEDARTFILPPGFDLIISMFDSLNHILTPRELTRVFSNVHRALKPGGYFLFDMITETGYRNNWDGYSGVVKDDEVCVTKNSYDPKKRLANFEATVFRLEKHWRRFDISLPEKCYDEAEIRPALEESGFKDVNAYEYDGETDFKKLTPDAERAFFLCRKS